MGNSAASNITLADVLRVAKVLIFDFDGTLVDSNIIKLHGFDACFAHFADFWPAIKAYCYSNHHTPRWEKFQYVFEQILHQPYSDAIATKLNQQYEAATTRQVSEAPEIRGAERFLKAAAKRYPLVLISSTPDAILREILGFKDWTKHFTAIRGAPLNKADWIKDYLKTQKLAAVEAPFFGDTAEDARAADAAGCPFVAVATGTKLNLKAVAQILDFREVSLP